MKQYHFFGEEPIWFDDDKTVRELVAYAFDCFDYFEPCGMDIVTVFQCHHPKSNTGWFTTDVSKKCSEEIVNPDELCFAYNFPNVFYYAEGGWGHHMPELGNHPSIPNPVCLKLRFEDFNNSVVINGSYCMRDVVRFLTNTGYISQDKSCLKIYPVGISEGPYSIRFSDVIMNERLSDFENSIATMTDRLYLGRGFVYHHILEI